MKDNHTDMYSNPMLYDISNRDENDEETSNLACICSVLNTESQA
jgi:hypothetical protein